MRGSPEGSPESFLEYLRPCERRMFAGIPVHVEFRDGISDHKGGRAVEPEARLLHFMPLGVDDGEPIEAEHPLGRNAVFRTMWPGVIPVAVHAMPLYEPGAHVLEDLVGHAVLHDVVRPDERELRHVAVAAPGFPAPGQGPRGPPPRGEGFGG